MEIAAGCPLLLAIKSPAKLTLTGLFYSVFRYA
jgi:hypothetical protein